MNNFKEVILGKEVLKYIRDCLDNGKTLSAYILKNIDLENGEVKTLIPSNFDVIKLMHFKEGGILSESPKSTWSYYIHENGKKFIIKPVNSLIFYLANEFKNFLSEGETQICLIQHYLAKPNDPWLSNINARILTFNDEVYFLLTKEDDEDNKIEKIFKEAETASPIYIGAFISLPGNLAQNYNQERMLTPEDFELFTKNIKKIIVGAYDGEGYLIWNRKEK